MTVSFAQSGSLQSSHLRRFRDDDFWRAIPRWAGLQAKEFADFRWQERNAVKSAGELRDIVGPLTSPGFVASVERALHKAPMSMRITPYLLALIDWRSPESDPLRRQFIPLDTEFEEDHPLLSYDSIAEQTNAPVEGLTHRYPDRVLFLATDVCPVYCRYCTRSYSVGPNMPGVPKLHFAPKRERWERLFSYVARSPEIEDVVVSGGDCYRLSDAQLRYIGLSLLDISHVRRLRFATRGLAAMPSKILTDPQWLAALVEIHRNAKSQRKSIAIHTHFNHPNEITEMTCSALNLLYDKDIRVRNQSVLLRGVNDTAEIINALNWKLSYLNVQPYYVYAGDMVKGAEALRTSLNVVIDIAKSVRGAISGYCSPAFVVDLPGGGGKRDVHSYEAYNPTAGLRVYRSPIVKAGRAFLYADPLRDLVPEMRKLWRDASARQRLIDELVDGTGLRL